MQKPNVWQGKGKVIPTKKSEILKKTKSTKTKMEAQVCNHYKYGYCKYHDQCLKRHVDGQCNSLHACKVKACNKRHPRICKRYPLKKFCKFKEECAYLHLDDTSSEVKNQAITLDCKESRHDLEIKKLQDEVKELRSEIKLLTAITMKFSKTLKIFWQIKSSKRKWSNKMFQRTISLSVTSVIVVLRENSHYGSTKILEMLNKRAPKLRS